MWSRNGNVGDSTTTTTAPTTATATSPDDIPMIHCNSSPSLATDSTSCNLYFLNELSSTEIDNPSSTTRLLRHQRYQSNSDMLPPPTWTSTTAVFEKNNGGDDDDENSSLPSAIVANATAVGSTTATATAEPPSDGYFTARASMVSLAAPPTTMIIQNFETTEDQLPPVTIMPNKPTSLLDAVFINIGQQTLSSSMSHSENSPTPSIQSGDVCRICHGEGTIEMALIAPCSCSGSMKYVHQECIQTWLKSSHSVSCELCRFTYLTGTKVKPIGQWKPLDLTLLERWKVVCCVMIQLFAICYFVLSVEALVRAAKDFHIPQAAMWLWIKIIMSVFGVSVSLACTVRQCKTFARLFRRLEMHNRIIYVKDRSESIEATSAARTLLGGGQK